jgi:hypothetical protein
LFLPLPTLTLTINGTNDAPILNATPVLTISQTEDTSAPSGTVGSLVSTLAAKVGTSPANITETDLTNPVGIAITALDTASGVAGDWYYLLNSGTTWTKITAMPSESAALLLQPADRLFFQPTANWHGAINESITFRAWDQSAGSAGSTADITTTGTGMRINGAHASGLRSMVLDAYTQFNQGGRGVHILNDGYAQLVSLFTINCNIGVFCESGGQCSLTNSNTSFGTFGLQADGIGSVQSTGTVNGTNVTVNSVIIEGLTATPAVNDVAQFSGDSEYYTVQTATAEDSGGERLVTFVEDLPTLANGTAVNFFKRSLIAASGHTFEYVGSGDTLAASLPSGGGVPVQENEVLQSNGGQVYYTSTDHRGDFRIGDDLLFNRATGTITGRTFSRSLFAVLTPYILALEGSTNN